MKINYQACVILGYSKNEIINRAFRRLVIEEEDLENLDKYN